MLGNENNGEDAAATTDLIDLNNSLKEQTELEEKVKNVKITEDAIPCTPDGKSGAFSAAISWSGQLTSKIIQFVSPTAARPNSAMKTEEAGEAPISDVTTNIENAEVTQQDIQEFDPLSKDDWMMQFLTPVANKTAAVDDKKSIKSPPPSLLDLSNEFSIDPLNYPKYSENDIKKVVEKQKTEYEKQMEILSFEVATLQEKYEASLLKKIEIEGFLKNYQTTMEEVINKSNSREEEHKSELEKINQEKKLTEVELHSVQISFKELHTRYEDLKIIHDTYRKNEENLKDIINSLQKDIKTLESRYETLKSHAQIKMEEANKEIAKVRAAYEKELSSLRSKLSKSEINIKSLEETVETKTRENEELMKICDQLILNA